MRQLIVNADDFGLHELINRGIVEGHAAGCITSTTIMAGGSAFEHAVELSKQHPKLGVGVHLTLVGASPVARADIHTLLTREGMLFSTYSEFIRRYIFGQISKAHIDYELRCQMQKVVGRGIQITHIDSHQHLHALPGMAQVIGGIARDFNVRKIRIPAEPLWFRGPGPLTFNRFFARAALTGCSYLAGHLFKRQGLFAPQHFFGMLAGGAMSQSAMQHIIRSLPDGVSEIMVHPGKNTQALEQIFPWGYHWQEEMDALNSKEVMAAIRERNIQLITYRELAD